MCDDSLFYNDFQVFSFDDLIISLRTFLKRTEISLELPSDSLIIKENFSRKSNSVVSWSFCIHEPYYPAPFGDDKFDKHIDRVFSFYKKELKKSGAFCVLYVNNNVLDKIDIVGSPIITGNNRSDIKLVKYRISDSNLLDFMCKFILYGIRSYRSNEYPFGCCYRYVQCSNVKRCVHPNKLFSTVCMYRHNLERGCIFYGENKNVSEFM